MDHPAWFLGSDNLPQPYTGHPRARRLLLEQMRMAITTERAALESTPDLPDDDVVNIRGRVSIMVGTIVVRLNREGFTQSERLYAMRDVLAEGKPLESGDLEWLNATIRELAESPGR